MGNRKRCRILILAVFMTVAIGIGPAYGAVTTYNSQDVPRDIVSHDPPVESTITVPCGGSIADVNVRLDITHTYDQDLAIFLIAPDGTMIELSTQNGGNGENYSGTIFDDEAATAITAGTAPFAGSYRPESPLAALDGMEMGGTWTLQVSDPVGGDDGTLNGWSLIIDGAFGTFLSSDVPYPVTTNSPPVTSTIDVSCGFPILDVKVRLDITHTFDEDLDIFLIAPDGTRIVLSTSNGGGGQNYTTTIFDDEAVTSITSGAAPFNGSYQPESPLSVLDGTAANGTWTLEVGDNYPESDDGTLNSWSLMFTTVAAGYTVSTYAGGLPATPAGLTVDRGTGIIYYADFDDCNGVLRKIARNGSVSMVTGDFTPNGDGMCGGYFYPYVQTDIQYLNGSVYVPLSDSTDGELVKINVTTGGATSKRIFAGFGYESGIVARKGKLLVTSGSGTASEIRTYDPMTGSTALALDVSPLPGVYNVEYDSGHDATYFWSAGIFYRADLNAGSYTAIPSYLSFTADFAVSPDGKSLFAVNSPNIDMVSIADGSPATLFNGLSGSSRYDMVLAPSSSKGGCSLYVADGMRILELSGIKGDCKPFPWPMFLPAITR